MSLRAKATIIAATISFSVILGAQLQAQAPDPGPDLTGLWKARKSFGPYARGPLIIERTGNGYTADMLGFKIPVTLTNNELFFELPNREGGFRGKLQAGGAIRGIWFSNTVNAATPITLSLKGTNRWAGVVVPQEDTQTFFLLLRRQPDGSFSALMRNIERDYGAQLGVRGLVHNGNTITLMGRRGAQTRDTVLLTGSFDSTLQVITLNFPFRGGSYDFRRDNDPESAFYPRGQNPVRYSYRVPPVLDDGWPTASVDEVGIDRPGIERAMQHLIDMSMDSINAPQAHAYLIARGGKLVLEEYFHGEHRDKPHNTRSGSKSVTAVITGAAMHAGAPIKLSMPAYQVMNGGAFPADLEPRKRAMTLEHLLTMSSGYFCDDNNESAPGNENGLWQQEEEPDFSKFALKLPMAFAPGERAIYCSINPHLALAVVGRAAGESPFYLFDRLVATPLNISHYVWAIDRARNPYGGGGTGFFTRDYMKFGQLMLNGGTWHGRRILSSEYVARASSPLAKINGQRDYGLAWWPQEYQYMNRTVRAFSALGAGGQIVYVFPELDLVIATNGGSYVSRGWRYFTGEFLTNFVLPAVKTR